VTKTLLLYPQKEQHRRKFSTTRDCLPPKKAFVKAQKGRLDDPKTVVLLTPKQGLVIIHTCLENFCVTTKSLSDVVNEITGELFWSPRKSRLVNPKIGTRNNITFLKHFCVTMKSLNGVVKKFTSEFFLPHTKHTLCCSVL